MTWIMQARQAVVPREGRRWMIEDFDIISTYDYFREGSLTVGEWLRSFKRLEEGLWFSWKDPWPFIRMSVGLVKRGLVMVLKKLKIVKNCTSPVALRKATGA